MGVMEQEEGAVSPSGKGWSVVSEGGGDGRRGGAALCYYVSAHHRSTQDLSASTTRG